MFKNTKKMEEKITFNIDSEDKEALRKFAKSQRLTLSSFCRHHLISKLNERILDEDIN